MNTRILEGMMQNILDTTRHIFEADGKLSGALFLNENGQVSLHALLWQSQQDKDAVSAMIQKKVEEGIVKEYILISECWALAFDKEVDLAKEYKDCMDRYGTIKGHPNAKETINCFYANSEKEVVHMAGIDKETRELGEWVKSENRVIGDPITWNSRFGNIFQTAAAKNN